MFAIFITAGIVVSSAVVLYGLVADHLAHRSSN